METLETLEVTVTEVVIFFEVKGVCEGGKLAAASRNFIQAVLPLSELGKLDPKEEGRNAKVLQVARVGAYRVSFTFRGLPYQPRAVRLFIEKNERRFNLLREGIRASQDGIHFTTIVFDRRTLQELYFLLISHGASVKIERIRHSASRKLGGMVWKAVHELS
nr:hypothetical protein [Candidatus Freyrarchaeum guaymaensis]